MGILRVMLEKNSAKCLVIAEIGNNHGGDVGECLKLIQQAALAGANIVKLQKRHNQSLFTKAFRDAPYDNENSFGATYGEHRETLELSDAEYIQARNEAARLNIEFCCTAFDIPSADFLQSIEVPFFKIASADLKNIPLLKHIRQFDKPMILSTGGATLEDIDTAYNLLAGKVEMALLHCVATYPNKPEEMNFKVIRSMKKRYPEAIIGFSSHHPSVFMSLAAYLMGAEIIEVHFTNNRAQKGTDHALSLEPKGLQTLVSDMASIHAALGDGIKRVLPIEEKAIRKMGKSIWPVKTIKAGEIIKKENIALKIPAGQGLTPDRYEDVIGRVAINDLSTTNAIREDDIGEKYE